MDSTARETEQLGGVEQAHADPASRRPLRAGYHRLFWGLLIVVVDVSINHFDLLPDFVGYLIVSFGAASLGFASKKFRTVTMLARVLVATSLFSTMLRGGAFGQELFFAELTLDLLFTWFLMTAVAEDAGARGLGALSTRAKQLRVFYLVSVAAGSLAMVTEFIVGALIATGISLATLIYVLWMLHVVPRRGSDPVRVADGEGILRDDAAD